MKLEAHLYAKLLLENGCQLLLRCGLLLLDYFLGLWRWLSTLCFLDKPEQKSQECFCEGSFKEVLLGV